MANGPLGGFMPTPAAPAQPPSVKVETTADSRGTFNNFLKNMNGATSLNPPSMAPVMGAMASNMAPALSNIDIFNPPIQNFFFGGAAMSGGGFSDADIGSQMNEESTVDDDPVAGFDFNEDTGSFDIVSTPTVSGDEQQQNIAESQQFVDTPSVPNVVFNNQAILNATKNLPEDNQTQIQFKKDIVNTLQDYAKDNDLAGALNQFQIEAAEGDKRGENIVNSIIQASNVNPAAYSAAVFNQPTASDILGTGEKNVMDAVNLDKPVDAFQVQVNPVFSPAMAGLPGVKSRFNTQKQTIPDVPVLAPRTRFARNVEDQRAAERGRALGPTTMDDSLDILDTFMTNQRFQELLDRGAEAQKIKDQQNRVQELLDLGSRAQQDKDAAALALGIGTPTPSGTKNITDTASTELDSEFGDVFPTVDPFAIEAPKVQALLNKTNLIPQATGFKVGETTIPSLASGINTLLSGATDMMNKRIYDGITKKGQTPVYDPVTGAITGSRDARSGVLMEGMDFAEQDRATSDNETTPIIRPIVAPKEEEKKDDDRPPNVIGGGVPRPVPEPVPTVVASPFAPASSAINPITFDSGDLNRLIEMLTGVAGKPVVSAKKGGLISMANGGLIKAVDDFLAAG